MRSRFRAQEVWERLGFDVEECLEFTEHSPVQQAFRALLFSRIVPCVKDIGLWGEKVQRAYTDLGSSWTSCAASWRGCAAISISMSRPAGRRRR